MCSSKPFCRVIQLLMMIILFGLLRQSQSVAAADKPVHLFILSGQSNMAGMKPELGFVPETKRLYPDAEVVYFKVARGGQPLRYWVTEWNDIARKQGIDVAAVRKNERKSPDYYQQILAKYREVLKQHPKLDSVTFCWMQGERDARGKLSAAYERALTQLIANLRRDLQRPKMQFVIGRLSDFGKANDTHWQAVRDAQVKVASADPLGSWVDCDDLNNKTRNGQTRDDLHYTADGYKLLGERYVRQAKLLLSGEPPAKNGRPKP